MRLSLILILFGALLQDESECPSCQTLRKQNLEYRTTIDSVNKALDGAVIIFKDK